MDTMSDRVKGVEHPATPERRFKESDNSAHVTEARLSQLFDPIARLADEQMGAAPRAAPGAERRRDAHPPPLPPPVVARDSAEYLAIIEPVHYDDSPSRYTLKINKKKKHFK